MLPANILISSYLLSIPKIQSLRTLFKSVQFLLMLYFVFFTSNLYALNNSIVAVDKDGIVGQYSSLVLDSQGNPIISYYDATEAKLKVVHCFEKNCALLNTIVTPDAANKIGQYTAMALDKNGNPVVSYYDQANSSLKVLHCGNTSCSLGNTIATVDSAGTVGQYTSITVDSKDNPVVSYYDATKGILKVLHCGNAACTAANSIVTPDVGSSNGVQSSIKLNAQGNPIIAYFDFTQSALKILRCGNSNCTAANSISTPDSLGDVGRYPSLILDANGNAAVSYLDLTNGKLKILRCGNASCTLNNTITSIGSANNIKGYFSSIALGAGNLPVVSYYDLTNANLNILRCGNASCTTNNTISIPDTGSVGQFSSLKLDVNGYPVVSYYDAAMGDLKVLHCGSLSCDSNVKTVISDGGNNIGRYTSIKIDSNGNPLVSYWDETNGDLKLLHCGNANCTALNNISTPDSIGNTGWDTSLALDANNNPVIGYYDFTAKIMKVLHCNNINCTGVNSINKPDILSFRSPSLTLDSLGHPVIASSGQADQGLRLVHCGDSTCSANNTITSPDFPAYPFQADIRGVSLALDGNGNPVASFYRADKAQLKILHCVDPACNGPGNAVTVIDPGAQAADHRSTSLTIDGNGYPVVAYQDSANKALKILHCGNANCSANNTIASPVIGNSVGMQPSIKLNTAGNPIVSFGSNGGMSVLHCGNSTCTAGNKIAVIDADISGWDSSLALDANDYPVVSYYNNIGKNLKIVHCTSATCQ